MISLSPKSRIYIFFFYCLIKLLFYELLGFILFFVMQSSYRRLVYRCLIVIFCLSSACYDVVLFVVLLQRFIFLEPIQTNTTDMISRIYQIMIVSRADKI